MLKSEPIQIWHRPLLVLLRVHVVYHKSNCVQQAESRACVRPEALDQMLLASLADRAAVIDKWLGC